MADLRQLERQLDSINALKEIVQAMRNLSAIYLRRAELTIEAIRPYAEIVETGLVVTLERVAAPESWGGRSCLPRSGPDQRQTGMSAPPHAGTPAPPDGGMPATPHAGVSAPPQSAIRNPDQGPALLLLFASDQGLCGNYNDRIVAAGVAFAEETGQVEFATIGHRGKDLLAMRGRETLLDLDCPTTLESIKARVRGLAARVYERYVNRGFQRLFFAYNMYESVGRFNEHVRQILPPGRETLLSHQHPSFRSEPLLTVPPAEALGHLLEEYFFIQLYRALLESHVSENGARLASMTIASTNIEEKFTLIAQHYHQARQGQITSDLLDVVSGAEALMGDT